MKKGLKFVAYLFVNFVCPFFIANLLQIFMLLAMNSAICWLKIDASFVPSLYGKSNYNSIIFLSSAISLRGIINLLVMLKIYIRNFYNNEQEIFCYEERKEIKDDISESIITAGQIQVPLRI